jgi:hypothetical protein
MTADLNLYENDSNFHAAIAIEVQCAARIAVTLHDITAG